MYPYIYGPLLKTLKNMKNAILLIQNLVVLHHTELTTRDKLCLDIQVLQTGQKVENTLKKTSISVQYGLGQKTDQKLEQKMILFLHNVTLVKMLMYTVANPDNIPMDSMLMTQKREFRAIRL